MSTIDVLKNSWENIDYFQGGALQIGVNHPLEWHVTYATPSNKALVIISSVPLKSAESSRCIAAKWGKRKDGKYSISFQLTDMSQEDVSYICAVI